VQIVVDLVTRVFLAMTFSEVKVKGQGQNHRTENLPPAIAQLWFKISSPNLAV